MKTPMFFSPVQKLHIKDIIKLTGCYLYNKEYKTEYVTNIAALHESNAESLVYIKDKKYAAVLDNLRAAALLCTEELVKYVSKEVAILVSENPYEDFLLIARFLYPSALTPIACTKEQGISPLAFIDPSARIESNVIVEAYAVIGAGVEIGEGSIISSGAVVKENCTIGRNCFIGSHSTIQCTMLGDRVIIHPGACIGQDGFGYVAVKNGLTKVPQIGRVIVQDDVEIGANTTIDRGTLQDTVIGEGSKIDNLVQIGHNVRIGRFCIIAAHSGISGSVTIGDRSMLGGRVGIKDHITIGENVQIAAASGVMHDIPDNAIWGGIPARSLKNWLKEVAVLKNIANKKNRNVT